MQQSFRVICTLYTIYRNSDFFSSLVVWSIIIMWRISFFLCSSIICIILYSKLFLFVQRIRAEHGPNHREQQQQNNWDDKHPNFCGSWSENNSTLDWFYQIAWKICKVFFALCIGFVYGKKCLLFATSFGQFLIIFLLPQLRPYMRCSHRTCKETAFFVSGFHNIHPNYSWGHFFSSLSHLISLISTHILRDPFDLPHALMTHGKCFILLGSPIWMKPCNKQQQ